ncbi:hypothetical protein CEP89_05795 [Streptobacillus moniliformis]|uniref:Uncharacterized protein n=1 Tax=Streptobacillus moniliformis (strain ATCC 14647 / DSM 12112 / NCTC 10651 / 9901) TaxID=519441 RepID=D1AV96_STRM9|nr:hypothetical protein [Streptobacillus moniliformis]ACZ01656.1 hypothetical protein Smon_1201 [Streptobacillus moniliformis DSM 12112]AVL43344.1 hypothetical protein CEP89_05795 [Streptobacillus moniliformis]SQA13166.1 Uncharacterised protein [Streptobacillus moniliformis]
MTLKTTRIKLNKNIFAEIFFLNDTIYFFINESISKDEYKYTCLILINQIENNYGQDFKIYRSNINNNTFNKTEKKLGV